MKIAFFELFKSERNILQKFFTGQEISCSEEKLTEENVGLYKEVEIISVFINSGINKKIIDSLPNLKFITTRSTGFDHIDYKYAENKGIKVSNVPAYGSYPVAEFTFALLLTLSRKIYDAYNHLREGVDFSIFSLQGFNLHGKTIGIIGTGRIGKNVVKIAKSFNMKVIAYDIYPDLIFAKENNFEYKSLYEVVSQSDILSLHVPYSKENYHLINKENISKMKRGVYLINTARGELIDTQALIWGLKEGIIGGAGLDVLEGERELKDEIEILSSPASGRHIEDYKTLLEDRLLIDMPNVTITPHIAFYTREAVAEILKTTILNIKGFLSNSMINLVK